MFDLGWSELLVIFVIGIVILKPKDISEFFRFVFKIIRKISSNIEYLKYNIEDKISELELDDLKNDIEKANKLGIDINQLRDIKENIIDDTTNIKKLDNSEDIDSK